jgi:hypothetical protein
MPLWSRRCPAKSRAVKFPPDRTSWRLSTRRVLSVSAARCLTARPCRHRFRRISRDSIRRLRTYRVKTGTFHAVDEKGVSRTDWRGERNQAEICQARQYAILIAMQFGRRRDEGIRSARDSTRRDSNHCFLRDPAEACHSQRLCRYQGSTAHEVEFMLKHTQSYLAEYGMVQSSGDCDVQVKYQPFGKFQAEEIGAIVNAGYWSQVGNVTVTQDGALSSKTIEPHTALGQLS